MWTLWSTNTLWFSSSLQMSIYFWAPSLNIKMHPCMAIYRRLWQKVIFLGTSSPRNTLWFCGFSNMSIDFEEPENQRVFLDHKVPKKMFFIYSRVYMVMQGCLLMLRVGAQKSIETFLRSPKIAQYSGVVFFVQNVFFLIKGCFPVIGILFSKMIV